MIYCVTSASTSGPREQQNSGRNKKEETATVLFVFSSPLIIIISRSPRRLVRIHLSTYTPRPRKPWRAISPPPQWWMDLNLNAALWHNFAPTNTVPDTTIQRAIYYSIINNRRRLRNNRSLLLRTDSAKILRGVRRARPFYVDHAFPSPNRGQKLLEHCRAATYSLGRCLIILDSERAVTNCNWFYAIFFFFFFAYACTRKFYPKQWRI